MSNQLNKLYNNQMQKDCSLRMFRSRNLRRKDSSSPPLSTSYSQKQLLNKSYKNQPFPCELKRRLIHHKLKFFDFSDEEQDKSSVVVQEEENDVLEKKKILPIFKVMSDRGQFLASRDRIRSQQKFFENSQPRCKSVESLKLPQVVEQKKQEEELNKLQLSKLSQFTDKNEFGLHNVTMTQSQSLTDHLKESLQPNVFTHCVPERIIQNQAEQTKSDKHKNDKSILDDELSKLIVDEVDDKKKKKEDSSQQIEQIILQERVQEQTDVINLLRASLQKFSQQAQFLSKFKQDELKISHPSDHSSNHSDNQSRKKPNSSNLKINQESIKEVHQNQEFNQ